MPILPIYIATFVFLVLNQSRFIFGGDSAEFSLVAKTWSIPHPPGYPFYSLLINVVNRLVPWGTTPWKIATVSSLSTVIASYLIFLILRRLKISTAIAIFSSLFYIILFPIWEYSEIPEVFALHNLLVIATTYFILLFVDTKKTKYFMAAAFLIGLSVSNHHVFVLFIPGWAYLLLKKQAKRAPVSYINKRAAIIAAALFFLGCAFYLYAPIAASFSPPLNWENPVNLTNFLRLITRASYGTFKAYNGSSGNILNQVFDILSLFIFMAMDFRIIGILLIGVGIITLKAGKSPFFAFLIISTLLHIFFLFYTNFVLVIPFTVAMYERFLIPLYMVMVFFLAFGIKNLDQFIAGITQKYLRNPSLKKVSHYFVPIFMSLYFFIVASQNYRTIRLIPELDIFATYAKNLLDTPPKNAVFFAGTDNSYFTSLYYRFGENYRTDLKFVFMDQINRPHYREYARKQYPDLNIPEPTGDRSAILAFAQENKKHGLYMETPLGASWKPYGLLQKQYDSEQEAISDSAKLVASNAYLWQHVYTFPKLNNDLNKILHLNVVLGNYLDSYMNYSKLLFATDNKEAAKRVVNELTRYHKNDLRTKFVLVNLHLADGDCKTAAEIVKSERFENLLNNTAILTSLKDYYRLCQPQRKEEIRQIEAVQKAAKKSISNL